MVDETGKYTNCIFEEPWWLDIVAPGEWHEATVEENGKVIARLPYVYSKGIVSNPVYTQTLGIWMDPSIRKYTKGNSQLHRQKEIISELLEQLPKAKKISLYLDNKNSYILPFRWHGYAIEPTFSYRIDNLSNVNPKEDLYGKTVKKNIKAAAKKVSIIDDSSDFGILLNMIDLTYARQGRKNPISNDVTLKLVKETHRLGHGRLMIALDKEDVPHSAAYFVYDERRCYYLLGGFNPDFNSDGSQNLLLDAGIRFAKTISNSFDFEGSMIEGIENFYRQFGGKQVINYHVAKQKLFYDIEDVMKPRIKRLIGYKI